MSTYLFINIGIILFPLLLSFEKRIKYYSNFKSLGASILIIGALYVGWDVFATSQGHWSFNPIHVLELKLFGLPLEEVLFFITVPYSCIFAYEGIKYYLPDTALIDGRRIFPLVVGIPFLILSILPIGGEYTTLAFISVGLTLIFISFFMNDLFSSKLFWIYTIFSIVVFLIFNYLLTSIPVVEYSSMAIIGFRIITIPIEDFMFNFSMLTLYLAIYLYFKRRKIRKKII
jgi:lycopene cyclase domain-containing protein